MFTVTTKIRRFGVTLAAAGALTGMSALPAHADNGSVGTNIVNIATANLGNDGCETNSAGGGSYFNSCNEEWCADFAKWVWQQAGVDVDGLTPGAASFATYNGGLSSTPEVGDAVVFGYNGAGYAQHVAIVTSVNTSTGEITSIGGNQGDGYVTQDGPYDDAVGSKSSWMDDMTLSGYATPIGGTTTAPPAPAPVTPHGEVWDRAMSTGGTWAANAGEIDTNSGITDIAAAALPNDTMHVETVVPGYGVWDRTRNADGTWTASQQIDTNGSISEVAAAALPDGTLHVLTLVDGTVWDRAMSSSGTWAAHATEIDPNGTVSALAVAALPNGTLHVETVAGGNIWDRAMSSDGTWAAHADEIDANGSIGDVAAAALPDGVLHVETLVSGSVWDRTLSAAGVWAAHATVIDPNGTVVSLSAAALPNGTLQVDTVAGGVWERTMSASGTWAAHATQIDTNASIFATYSAGLPDGTFHVGSNVS